MTRLVMQANGLRADADRAQEKRQEAAQRYAQRRQAALLEAVKNGELPAVKRTRIKPVSDRRAEQLADYRPLRDAYLAAHPNCERCGKPTECLHHKKGRVGALLIATEYWAASCASCNQFPEDHTGEALAEGWLLRSVGVA